VITFGMNFAEGVFVKEVVADDQPSFILRQRQIVRSRVRPEIRTLSNARRRVISPIRHRQALNEAWSS
jgi:hypothetical protein